MRVWRARLLTLLTGVVMLLAVQAGPVMADDDLRCHERDRNDTIVCHERGDRGDRVVFREDDEDFEDFDEDVFVSGFFFPFFIGDVEFFCDEDDDDVDGFIECEDLFAVVELDDFDLDLDL